MVKLISIQEFWEGGYLQEINRQFLHPLGLALAIERTPAGTCRIVGVFDARGDPEGFRFGEDMMLRSKGLAVMDEQQRRRESREAALGYYVQPLPEGD